MVHYMLNKKSSQLASEIEMVHHGTIGALTQTTLRCLYKTELLREKYSVLTYNVTFILCPVPKTA